MEFIIKQMDVMKNFRGSTKQMMCIGIAAPKSENAELTELSIRLI